MPTETTNYKLKKPLSSEKYDVEIFNENADKIEAGMLANYQAIQTKQNTITGSATTITSATLTKDRVVITNSSGKIAVSDITSTELGYLDGVTSNVQTQINSVASSVTSEASTRASADTTLQGKIDAEASARSSADTTLQANIDKKVGKSGNETIEGTKTFTTIPVVTVSTSSTATGKQLTTADWVIGKVNASATTLEGKITTEATARASGDSALQGKIDAEATARGTAITNLQTTLQANIDGKVSKSGDVVSGTLTFYKPWIFTKSANADNIVLKNLSITGSETGSRNMSIDHTDNNNTLRGQILFSTNKYHSSGAYLLAGNGSGVTQSICIVVNDDGTFNANAPTPSDKADNSTKIATTGWVNTASSVVHTTGNETIGGTKTFASSLAVNIPIASGVAGAGAYRDIMFQDNGSVRRGIVRTEVGNAQTTVSIRAYNFTNTVGSALTVHQPESGTGYASAPSPAPTQSAIRNITVSTSAPSGGNDGDLWAVYE